MRFVHILLGSPDPRTVNGVNKVVHWLATTQCEQGHDSQVWALRKGGQPMDHDHIYKGVSLSTSKLRFLLSKDVKQAIGSLEPDTWVQLHSVFIPEFRPIAKMLNKRGIRYGFTAHGGYLSLEYDKGLKMKLKKKAFSALWENWVVQNASMLHIIGSSEQGDLLRKAPNAKTYLIPNGYASSPESTTAQRTEIEPAAVMFCGRHEIKQKGLDKLFYGFAQYKRSGGALRLVMISGGKDNAFLKALADDLGIAEEITWTGVLPVEELRSTLKGAAAFVHSSQFDVLPTACLEAAALGIPLFASKETNFDDYVTPRRAGWIYGPNTPTKIASTLFEIENTSPADRLAMGENARRMISEELRWDLICNKFQAAAEESMQRA